jgi:5-(carboxyamino)imidazole ribonucleotide mutase
MTAPLVGIVMGSRSDYAVMKAAVEILREFAVPYEARVVSAHRTPELMVEYAQGAVAKGLRCIIAGAGGAAHLPGMIAALTVVPVLGVPVAATALQGFDSLLSIVQMPKGVPVGTLAIGASGAANAALLAVAMLATTDPALQAKLIARREAIRNKVLSEMIDEITPKSLAAELDIPAKTVRGWLRMIPEYDDDRYSKYKWAEDDPMVAYVREKAASSTASSQGQKSPKPKVAS